MKRNKDRRAARRYDLSLPITVRAGPEQAGPRSGRTRDISPRGVYFMTDQEFPLGSKLHFNLTLPAKITRGTEVVVRAQGRVVRAEKKMENETEHVGLAVTIDQYEILRVRPTLLPERYRF